MAQADFVFGIPLTACLVAFAGWTCLQCLQVLA